MTAQTPSLQARVQALLAQGALEEAEALLQPLRVAGSGPIPLWHLLALVVRRQGRITEARAIQQMLVDAVPGDLAGRFALAETLLLFGRPPAGMALKSLSDEIAGFDDTAAILCLADLLIFVDSAPTHLAGALGRPAWVMLPFVPDWRWLMDRDDTPWYASRDAAIGPPSSRPWPRPFATSFRRLSQTKSLHLGWRRLFVCR